MAPREGWQGWDEYAPFYDWENAQTLGRRDVSFWRRTAGLVKGRVLELGCGTGRISIPLARAGVALVGVDRSAAMLERAYRRAAKRRNGTRVQGRISLIRGDIRALPFRPDSFSMVMAPYGVLQSLLHDRDLSGTISAVSRVLARGGVFGVDLVPDVPNWREYEHKVQLKGPAAGGVHLTLIESVRQQPRKQLTTFEQCYVERRGRRVTKHRFELTFRTLPIQRMLRKLEGAGFAIEAVLGDYRGRAWDERSDVWIILARRI
jgi:ubiquinone/menaquinone biosynthesis C-methylase UbiE